MVSIVLKSRDSDTKCPLFSAAFSLIFTGLFELVGMLGRNLVVKHNKTQSYIVLIPGFLAGFSLLSIELSTLPMGLAYAVWMEQPTKITVCCDKEK